MSFSEFFSEQVYLLLTFILTSVTIINASHSSYLIVFFLHIIIVVHSSHIAFCYIYYSTTQLLN